MELTDSYPWAAVLSKVGALYLKAFAPSPAAQSRANRVVLVSILAPIVTMLLKFSAYMLTHSVSLLGDAAKSSVNLMAALVACGPQPARVLG